MPLFEPRPGELRRRAGVAGARRQPAERLTRPSPPPSVVVVDSSSSSIVVVVVFVVVVVLVVIVVVVVVVGGFELDGGRAGHFEIGAAVGAADQIALVDVELVDFDIGVTFRTGGHTCSWRERLPGEPVGSRRASHDCVKSSDYSENLINSATN